MLVFGAVSFSIAIYRVYWTKPKANFPANKNIPGMDDYKYRYNNVVEKD
jgi:hypothetical protein